MKPYEILVMLRKSVECMNMKSTDENIVSTIYAALQNVRGFRGISGVSVAKKIFRESEGDILAMASLVSDRINSRA